VQKLFDQANHVADMISRAAQQRRFRKLNIEPRAVLLELCDIEVGDLSRRFVLGTGGFFDFVFAAVLVRRHVTNVSDIHYVADREAIEAKRTLERVDKHIGAHVTQMLRQIHSRSA